jgi:phytoene dehydrogenase-like protein
VVSDAEVIVIGSGPNGLAAAIRLAAAGLSVTVVEAADRPGGGARTEPLTLPGFAHDRCAACLPMAIVSPYLRRLPLAAHGLGWASSDVSFAHPLDDQPAVLHHPSIATTAEGLGRDGPRYRRMLEPLLADPHALLADLLAPLGVPRAPLAMARFGLMGALPATWLGACFSDERARALLAGCAGHATQPLSNLLTGAVALVFALVGHVAAWPVVVGGTERLIDAMVGLFRALGGTIVTSRPVRDLADFAGARAILFATDPHQVATISGDALPAGYRRRLGRFRFGPASYKLDWALDGPIPWADPRVGQAATVHLGGTMAEIAASEAAAYRGEVPDRPYVLLVQQSALDPSRAPAGQHTGYAYMHVPPGCEVDCTARIEAQVERFAPGFRDRVLARHVTRPSDFASYNLSFVGGAVTGGTADLTQMFTRPVARLDPYRTPNPRIFIGSSGTPPGGGVHGMGGYHAARSVLRALGVPESRGEPAPMEPS